MARCCILSLDSGGIRGIITTIVLERFASDPNLAGWLDSVNLTSKTSMGELIALGLAYGLVVATDTRSLRNQGR